MFSYDRVRVAQTMPTAMTSRFRISREALGHAMESGVQKLGKSGWDFAYRETSPISSFWYVSLICGLAVYCIASQRRSLTQPTFQETAIDGRPHIHQSIKKPTK